MWCTFLQELELGPNWARLRLILSNSGPLTQGGWSWSAGCDEDWLPPMPGTRALASIGGWQLSDWQTGHRGRTGAPLPDTDSTQQGRGSGKFKSWLIPSCQKSRSTWIYFRFFYLFNQMLISNGSCLDYVWFHQVKIIMYGFMYSLLFCLYRQQMVWNMFSFLFVLHT